MKVRVGDVEIFVREWGAGEPLLMVHGLGMSGALWRAQVEAFSKRFRMIAVDLRGFGQSSRPSAPGSYAIEVLAEDIAGVASALGLDSFHFLGTSMGGFIGQALALAHPERCRSLVLAHTGPRMSIPADVLESRLEMLRTSPLEEYAELVFEQATGEDPSDELRAFISGLVVANDKRAYSQVLTEGLKAFDLSERVAEISRPTLVVVGELDGVIPPDQGRELAKKIPGSKLVEIPRVGHLGYAEDPASFNRAVLEFLDSV